MATSLALWRDRRGRVSALRIAVLAFLATPVVLAAQAFLTAGLGARPINDLIHRAGYWALVFLLVTLAVTSTDGMVRRLGSRRWQRLHQLVYGIALLALIHFFQQTKADIWVPTFVAGLFVWLMGYRLLMRWRKGAPTALALLMLAIVVSALVFAAEAIGIGLYYNVSPLLVLQSTFEFDLDMIRPGWLVLGAGLCVVMLQVVQAWRQNSTRVTAKPAPTTTR